MLRRILIGLMVVTFVLIGIHLSWGASHSEMCWAHGEAVPWSSRGINSLRHWR